MHQLARITTTDDGGKPISLAASDISTVTATGDGSIINLRSGEKVKCKDSVSTINTALDALWDQFITALGT